MRPRIIVGVLLLIGLAAAGTLFASGDHYVGPDKQWTVANFAEPVRVQGQFVMGPVIIVHDSAKMARGEACTTFYRFDRVVGKKEALVSVHCSPRPAAPVATTTFATMSTEPGCKRLVEYQIAGDSEAHVLPTE